MRVAVVTSSYPAHPEDPSGHFVRAELRSLIEAGHEVTLLVPKATYPRHEPRVRLHELTHAGLFGWPGTLTRLKERPWRAVGLLPFVRAARNQLKVAGPFDRLLAHWLLPGFWPICCDFDAETHVVAHGTDVGVLERLPTALQRSVVSALCRDNVAVRCVSRDLSARLSHLSAKLATGKLRIAVAPSPLEVPNLPSRAELQRELCLDGAPVVVVVGRAVKDKRIDLAISAILSASSLIPPAITPTIVVVGDGPERAAWMRRFPAVRWLGQLGRFDALRYIRAAHLLVSASEHEGAPSVIREARILGTEVVAAKAGDLADLCALDQGLHVITNFTSDPSQAACQLISQVLARTTRQ